MTDHDGASPIRPRTLVIIPAFNEEDALPGVLADLAATVPDLDILVVDDGSSDKTSDLARAAGVTVVRLPFNLGIGGALRAGFLYATRQGYARAIQFDADGQHETSQIGVLLSGLDDGADMVIGSRFADEAHSYDVGRVRQGAMGVLRFVVKQLSGTQYSDTSSGFRAFSQPVVEFFSRDYPEEYMESVEALMLAVSAGFNVVEVPVQMAPRAGGEASTRRLKLLYHYLRLMLVIVAGRNDSRRDPQSEND